MEYRENARPVGDLPVRVGAIRGIAMAILKVLSCHPDGVATIAALNADLAVLNTSGKDWMDRMRRLSACVPDLDLFGQKLVVRLASGWQITDAGRAVLLAAGNQSRIPPERDLDRAAGYRGAIRSNVARRSAASRHRDRRPQDAAQVSPRESWPAWKVAAGCVVLSESSPRYCR